MANPNTALTSEVAAVAAVIDPDVTAAGNADSDWVDMSKFESIMAIAMAGTLGTSATFDALLRQATSAAGAGAKAITGKAITQLVKATDDDKQAVINCRASELDLANDFRFVSLRITVAVATSDACGIVLGFNPASAPASDNDLASVAEIVA